MTLRVNIEDVVSSAVEVTGQGENLAAAHQDSDATMAGAGGRWQGRSAQALTAKLDAWARNSATLVGRMSGHAQGLHNVANGFSSLEQQRVAAMRSVSDAGDAALPAKD